MKEIKNETKILEAFNNMPFENKKISIEMKFVTRIRELEHLKVRVKANYVREIKFIDDQIKSYERSIDY